MIIESKNKIETGTKIQNLYLQKHVLKTDYNRYKFVSIDKHPITESTIENLKSVDLKPEIVDCTNMKMPTLVASSTSVLKRRSTGTLAQMWLGYNLMKNENEYKGKTEHSWDKTTYITKVYDSKHRKYQDCIVGIASWLIAVNSGGYEWKLSSTELDEVGRFKNTVSCDPFAMKVLMYSYPELANAFIRYQLKNREIKLKKYLGDMK